MFSVFGQAKLLSADDKCIFTVSVLLEITELRNCLKYCLPFVYINRFLKLVDGFQLHLW